MKGPIPKWKHVYLMFCWFYLRGCMCNMTIDQDKCGFSGESVTLSCTLLPVQFVQPIEWSNGIIVGDISVCTTGGCTPPGEVRYSAAANTTGVYLTINGLISGSDGTTWTCTIQGGSLAPQTYNLVVRDYPTSCVLKKTSDGNFKCETDCGSPGSDLTIDWFLNTSNVVRDLSNPSVVHESPAACSGGGKAHATFPASDISEDGHLYCKCGMQTACPEKALLVSNSEKVTEPDCNCDAVLALGIIGILISVGWMIFTGIVHFQVLKLKTDLSLLAAVLITVICVIALILCIAGIVVCEVCKTKDAETTGLILAAVGFVCSLIPIIMILLNRFGVLTRSSSNPANERDGPDGQEGKHSAAESKPRTEVSPRSAGSPTSASKIRPKWKNNQVSDSNESDGSNDTPRGGKLGNVPPGRKLPPLTATALDVDGGQKSNSLAPLDTTETKKLRKKKKRRSKEEKQDNGE